MTSDRSTPTDLNDAQLDELFELAGLPLTCEDAPAIRDLARKFLAQAALLRESLPFDAEPTHVFDIAATVRPL
jgi:hypothetical protein